MYTLILPQNNSGEDSLVPRPIRVNPYGPGNEVMVETGGDGYLMDKMQSGGWSYPHDKYV